MSKYGELKMIRYGRSIDAPINYHHRTGDLEDSGGSILDFYVHEESAEEVYLDGEDELAKARFLKGFSGYLRKVFSRQERKFLSRLMSGEEQPREVARALGVDWFKYMQALQRKAYKNVKPLLKLSELTGWSRAEEFTAMIMRRLALLEDGAELEDILPKSVNRAKIREEIKGAGALVKAEKRTAKNLWQRRYQEANKEKVKAYQEANKEKINAYRAANKEKRRAHNAAYYQANKEKRRAHNAAYYQANKEKIKAREAAYYQANKEKIKAREAAYYQTNKEKVRAHNVAYYQTNKEKVKACQEANKEKMRAHNVAYYQANKEKMRAHNAAYYQANKEEIKARKAAYREAHKAEIKAYNTAYRARRKAERAGSKIAKIEEVSV